MALTCDPQGMIEVDAIMDAVNKNETDIAGLGGGNTELEGRVSVNETNISGLNGRVVALENQDYTGLEPRIAQNEADIADNVINISSNTTSVGTLSSDVADHESRISTNEIDIESNLNMLTAYSTLITDNEAAIADHETRISALEAVSGLGLSVLVVHEEATSINGGTSVAATWTPRNVQTERYNSLGATVGPTSVTLEAGTYKAEAFAVVNGSPSQTRISIGGTAFIYGTSLSSDGQSFAMGKFTIASATSIYLETNVTTGVTDTGFGESSSFGESNVYTSLHIDKVG